MDELTPGLTPPDNPENALFSLWELSSEEERPAIALKMMPALRRHASKVCWMVLHFHDPHLIDEIVQDTILELDRFEKRSSFTTWFHSRALNRCRVELKKIIRRREVPFTGNEERIEEVGGSGFHYDANDSILLDQITKKLSPKERKILTMKISSGYTDKEIAEILGYTRQWIQTEWKRLRDKLKEEYDGDF